MAATVETVAEHVKPLEGAIVRRYTAGSAITAGMPVTLASDGYLDPSDATDVTLSFCKGIAIQSAAAAGDPVDVVVFGPVYCMTGATVGALVFVSDTGGALAESVGTKDTIIGQADTANILFVNIQIIDLA
jgi:inorganic pyrophosphatase